MLRLLRTVTSLPNKVFNQVVLRIRNVEYKSYPKINGRIVIGGWGLLKLGSNVKINSSYRSNPVGAKDCTSIHIGENAKVFIGDNVGISNSLIYSATSIEIEANVFLGGGCQVYDTDFHSIQYRDRVEQGDKKVKTAPVKICAGAFIGACSIILKGVTIGERSVVGAGSVVVKDIPADEVWGGNPCKFLKKL